MVKIAWVVVKLLDWWLEPTTSDQCGQNAGYIVNNDHWHYYLSLQLVATCLSVMLACSCSIVGYYFQCTWSVQWECCSTSWAKGLLYLSHLICWHCSYHWYTPWHIYTPFRVLSQLLSNTFILYLTTFRKSRPLPSRKWVSCLNISSYKVLYMDMISYKIPPPPHTHKKNYTHKVAMLLSRGGWTGR